MTRQQSRLAVADAEPRAPLSLRPSDAAPARIAHPASSRPSSSHAHQGISPGPLPPLSTDARNRNRNRQALCAYHLILTYLLELRPCGGASMLPTLSNSGDLILHSPLYLRWSSPATLRGALVTAVSPLDPGSEVLKRVIGVAGDTVAVDPSGERARRAAGERARWEDRARQEAWVKVPQGHVWLAGDNCSNSTDSRDYGPVPVGLLKGRVVGRVSWVAGFRVREGNAHGGFWCAVGMAESGTAGEQYAADERVAGVPGGRLSEDGDGGEHSGERVGGHRCGFLLRVPEDLYSARDSGS